MTESQAFWDKHGCNFSQSIGGGAQSTKGRLVPEFQSSEFWHPESSKLTTVNTIQNFSVYQGDAHVRGEYFNMSQQNAINPLKADTEDMSRVLSKWVVFLAY